MGGKGQEHRATELVHINRSGNRKAVDDLEISLERDWLPDRSGKMEKHIHTVLVHLFLLAVVDDGDLPLILADSPVTDGSLFGHQGIKSERSLQGSKRQNRHDDANQWESSHMS